MLKARILTAIVLLAGFLAALYWLPQRAWLGIVAVMIAAAAWEWAGLARLPAISRWAYAAAVAAAALLAGWLAGAGPLSGHVWLYIAAVGFWLVLAPLWLWERPVFGNPLVPLLVGAVILVPCAAAMVALRAQSPTLLLEVLAVPWISDIAAYFTGWRYGKRKLAPSVSPGKTWEGVYGALAAVTVYAICLLATGWNPGFGYWQQTPLAELWFVLLMLALAVAGIEGDLLESQMKRQAGLKDSGSVLPGHGGVLDRIDALLPVLPLAALVFLK